MRLFPQGMARWPPPVNPAQRCNSGGMRIDIRIGAARYASRPRPGGAAAPVPAWASGGMTIGWRGGMECANRPPGDGGFGAAGAGVFPALRYSSGQAAVTWAA